MVSEQTLMDSGGGGTMTDWVLDCSALTATNASRDHVVVSCSIQKRYQQGLDSVLAWSTSPFSHPFCFRFLNPAFAVSGTSFQKLSSTILSTKWTWCAQWSLSRKESLSIAHHISCRSSPVAFFRSLMCIIISSANNGTLTSFFSICSSLISFSCLIALARTSCTILNSYRESEQLRFVPDFGEIALSFSPFILMLAIGLL